MYISIKGLIINQNFKYRIYNINQLNANLNCVILKNLFLIVHKI